MESQPDVSELTEELTIQQVILNSMLGETFEGVETEREEARLEIERLKGLLAKADRARRESLTAERQIQDEHASGREYDSRGSEEGSAGEPHQLAPSDGRQPSTNPKPNGSSHSNRPAYSRRTSSAVMATPSRRNDIWSSPTHSLPSRKREFDSTRLGVGTQSNKSRRTTPTPAGLFSSPSRHYGEVDPSEIIDLTGDDVDQDANLIAEQIKQFERREQEKRDRDMAMQMSSQEVHSPIPITEPQQNAFTRIMGPRQASAPSMPNIHDQWPSHAPPSGLHSVNPSMLSMPGSYDPAWDDPFNSRPAMPTPQTHNQTQIHTPHGNMDFRDQNGYGGVGPYNTNVAFPASQGASPFNGHKMPASASSTPGFIRASHQLHRTPSMPQMSSHGGLDLMNVIHRTNMFNYATGTDADGDPLSERLTNYLQDAYHDPRVSEKELDELLQNIRPDMDISESHRGSTPVALKSSLYPHQELALSWMMKMEEGTNKGGILADDMGLGKTISTLALMHARPAKSRPKTNLIIGPLSLIRQWEEEILKKTKPSHRLSVFVYHGKKATTDDLLQYDVVLTTYGTIAQELKRLEKFYKDNADRNIDFNDKGFALKCPLLHPKKASFYRVILDEAQCIKNSKTQTAKACYRLKSTYRWCLTGTPMMNGVLELYSLLNFLRIKPYSVWENFRQAFGQLFGRQGDPKSVAMNRLRALLKAIMLRRKKNSELDGKPILRLPEKTEEVVYAELSPDEHDFYKQLEHKSQVQFSKYLRDGTVGKNYSSILVLLLRLRQACCHPHLNLDVDDATVAVGVDMMEVVRELPAEIVSRIKAIEAFECPICQDAVPCPTFFVPCGHDTCQQCLVRLVDDAVATNLREGNESDKAKCPLCRGQFDPKNCFTYDAFQKVHMASGIKDEDEDSDEESESDEDLDAAFESDDEVNENGDLRDFIVPDGDIKSDEDDEPTEKKPRFKSEAEDELLDHETKVKKSKKKKGKKKKAEIRPTMLKSLRKEASKNREAFRRYMRYLRKTWLPAAKLEECMQLLKSIQETGEKTIIFSQWTLLLDLLEVAMWHDKLDKPLRYDGSMSGEARNAAAQRFRTDKPKVMLVSLRAGNAGLNLTTASRVIIMDPFWNPYIEMQAVDRAYRIGQQRPVKVYRILTKDTVEDRIVALQEKKKEMVEAALDEKESMKIGRLTANELKFLFNAR